ncbi:acyltransferase family protein [Mucilaginibacter sp. E4BP6]|uniref:acyltransferase family protein n=1 Tax=Mucilaginibacter sp. E4BP6 TaxID=2723089 RepID=UPI0015CDAB45|nr:acyltransferase [Mucilaginibacter sp. E4BP6]NYE66012.1 peptidoglycan/LPS O-acetylase OafA/YrhL [Mucilaginibacter sp. E4BP6]
MVSIKPAKKKLKKLEAVRGFAAVYVVLHHLFAARLIIAGKDFSILFRFGQEAVILFFLLSGFVIQYAFSLSTDKSFRTFFTKRFLRIYIPLICVFIANYSLDAIQSRSFLRVDFHSLAATLLMLQDTSFLKPHVIADPFLGNTPLWSLSYEWWFYMVFFLVIAKIHKRPSQFVYILGILSAITYVIYPNFINNELMYLVIWWVGADMAKLYLQNKEINLRSLLIPLAALSAVTLILIINVMVHNRHVSAGVYPFLELRHFIFALITVIAALIWKKLNWRGFNSTIGLFEHIAPISFGIYISHWFLVADASYLNGAITNTALRTCCYILICIVFAYIIERVIYIKLNKWLLIRFTGTKK